MSFIHYYRVFFCKGKEKSLLLWNIFSLKSKNDYIY